MFPERRFPLRSPASLVALLGASLALAACGSSSSSSSSSGSSPSPAATTSSQSASPSASGTVDESTITLASQFAGVNPGKANPSLAPLVIGYNNEQGSTPSFDEMSHAADASVQFINDHLGGINGHPLMLDKCIVLTEEDGQKCGAQFRNGKLKLGNQGLTVLGNAAFFKTIGGTFPVIVSGQGGGADVTTPHVYEYDGGGALYLSDMVSIAKKQGSKTLAIISSANPAGKYAMQLLVIPVMQKLGLKYKIVYVADTGTTPDYVSALQASGAASADMVMLIPAKVTACISVFDALKQLGINKKVVATYTCYGDPFPQHAGAGAANWIFAGYTANPRVSDNPQVVAWRNIMTAYGQAQYEYTGDASKELQDLLLITKFGNELGYDHITPAAMDNKIKTYKGPGFTVPGTLDCAAAAPPQIGVCGNAAAASTFKNGQFVTFPF
jgi:branched-chain amino acid transport system substrate-binding protein